MIHSGSIINGKISILQQAGKTDLTAELNWDSVNIHRKKWNRSFCRMQSNWTEKCDSHSYLCETDKGQLLLMLLERRWLNRIVHSEAELKVTVTVLDSIKVTDGPNLNAAGAP